MAAVDSGIRHTEIWSTMFESLDASSSQVEIHRLRLKVNNLQSVSEADELGLNMAILERDDRDLASRRWISRSSVPPWSFALTSLNVAFGGRPDRRFR